MFRVLTPPRIISGITFRRVLVSVDVGLYIQIVESRESSLLSRYANNSRILSNAKALLLDEDRLVALNETVLTTVKQA